MGIGIALLSLFLASPPPEAPEQAYRFKILDIIYRTETIGGRVEDFQVRESAIDIRLELNADVLFEFDKAELLPDAEPVLQKTAAYLEQETKSAIRIEGHTDSKGDEAYNMRLSLQRAEAVRRWLRERGGIDPSRMSASGLGEKNPVTPNSRPDGSDDPEGRRRNRRVEIVIRK